MAAPTPAALDYPAQARKGRDRLTGDEHEPQSSHVVGQSTVHVVMVRLIRSDGDDDFAHARVVRRIP